MMVVSAPVLPPSYEPDSYPLPGPASRSAISDERSSVPFPSLSSPFLASRSSPRASPVSPEIVLSPSLPPTPDPSPPTTKVLFPVEMIPLADPAPESSKSSSFAASRGDDSSGSSSSHSTSAPRRSPILVNTQLPMSTSEVLTPKTAPLLSRSETQPSLSRASTGRSLRSTEREDKARGKSRRQTVTGPTSHRMVESKSADGRHRLRSTGPSKLLRYNSELPASSSTLARARRQHPESATPPRIFVPTASEAEDLDFGGPGGLEAKLVLLGSQAVGKTSLILRLTTGSFSAIPAPASLDGSFYKRKLVHNGVPVKLQIWDTAGQERFRSMAPIYYRGAHVCLLVYDISDRKSFLDVRSWLDELHSKASKDMIIYVVGAKTDLELQRAVSFNEARRTIRAWLTPQEQLEAESNKLPPQTLSPVPRSLFRSTSGHARHESTSVPPTGRARPHSMHGLASLMAAATDWAEFDSPTAVTSPHALPTVIAPSPSRSPVPSPSPAPTVHFPSSLTAHASGPLSSGSSSGSAAGSFTAERPERPKRVHRVSFHAPAPPSEPTSGTTTETATASTTHNLPRHNSRFSITGVLGLTRSPSMSMSDAMSELAHLAEANPVSPRVSLSSPRSPYSPMRVRTESSPMLGGDIAKHRSEEWSRRPWGRGEGPSAADALEEFGAVVRGEVAARSGRARGGSLGRDSRLHGGDSRGDEADDETSNSWGVEIGNVRLGEVSSLTGEGVEALCRSISACLVERKDKIERERTLRHKHSVMLTDPTKDTTAGKTKGRYACCV